jgi:putative two-component system response regulator
MDLQVEYCIQGNSFPSLEPVRSGVLIPVSAGTGGTILVVDDDEQIRELLRDLLMLEGLNVITAADGEDCLKAILCSRPDVVLLDVRLPLIDGFEVCRRIKGAPGSRFTPVVMITGLSAVEDRICGIEAGADDFLTKPIDRHQLVARVKSLLTLKCQIDTLEPAEAVLLTLARTIDAKDSCTQGHCERLAAMSIKLGQRMWLQPEQIAALWRAGIVHDIGKVGIPESILLKPSKLNDEEWALMRQHPAIGENICRPLKSFRSVLPIIRHHHEKLDGSGYPDGLMGNEITLPTRVLQIVDVYDALLTKRPYKPALTQDRAFQIMQEEVAKGWWDGAVLDEFQALCCDLGQQTKNHIAELSNDYEKTS